MKQLIISIISCCFVLFILLSQVCCDNRINNRTISYTVINDSEEPLLLWFSSDSSALHYLYGVTKPGTVSIMQIVHESPVNPRPIFTIPYNGFIKVLEHGDSLTIHNLDSVKYNDLCIKPIHELPFITDFELKTIKKLSYMEDSIVL